MIDKVNTLIDAIKPARLAKDLNIKIHSKRECYFINEPGSTSNYLFLKDKEFINSNLNSDFAAGNIVSFISHYYEKTFEEAIVYLLKKYFNKLSQPIHGAISWASASMAAYLKAHDTLFTTIQKQKKLLNQDPRYSKCRQYLREHAFNENYVKDIVAPFSGTELNDFFTNISDTFPGLSKNFSKKRVYLVFPIHVNYSFISAVWVFCPQNKKIHKFQIMPYSRGFFGLHNLRPGDSCSYVLPTIREVIEESHKFYDHGDHNSQACVSIVYNNSDNVLLPDPIYQGLMVISDETSTEDIIKTQASFHELGLLNKNQRFKVGFDQAREARTYLINKFILDANQENASEDVLVSKLTQLQTDPIVIDRIRHFLNNSNKTKLLSLIDSNMYQTEIKNIKGSIVTQSKDGYIASGEKGLSDVLFTNFTIKLNKTIMFKDSSDTYYTGDLYIGSKKLPYMVSKREINQATHIVNAANASVASARDLTDIKPPALLDSTFSGVLRGIIADQISNSEIEIGVARLGWSDSCDTFTAPGWTSTGSNLRRNSGFKHPTVQILNNFNFTPKTIDRISATFNTSHINILLALVTSMLGRGFHDMRCSPVRILNNKNNRLLLASLLSVFQQKRTIDLNPNLRVSRREDQMLPGIRGLPMVCSCSNSKVLDRLYEPVFTLSNTGLSFMLTDSFDYDQLARFSAYYFPYLINELIQSDGNIFNPDYENRSIDSMIKEGLSTMQLIFPGEAWFITRGKHPELESWLCQQSLELFQESIKLDFKQQKIRINLTAFPNFPQIKEYLEAAEIPMHKISKKYLIVNSEKFLKLLNEIFVEAPKIGACNIEDNNLKRKVINETDGVRLG